jgi:NADPH:quinone reductase-like Zn-dependent oxidoreductase
MVENADKPSIAPGHVLVEVYAAGVNPFDWKVREGMVRQMAELTFPGAVLGGDLAGVVAEVGADVTNFQVGDEVYGLAGALSSHGSFAQFVSVASGSLNAKPSNVDFTTAAGLPLAGLTTYQALVETLKLTSGQKILIHGGAGGIGSIAIQLAKHLGATVATTVSAAGIDYVNSLKADVVIDYRKQSFADELSDYDAVFDTIGGEVYSKSFDVLRAGGAIVSISSPVDEALATQHQVSATSMYTQVTAVRLAELTKLVEAGIVTINIDRVFPLEQAGEALEYLKTGHPIGKVVIKVRD